MSMPKNEMHAQVRGATESVTSRSRQRVCHQDSCLEYELMETWNEGNLWVLRRPMVEAHHQDKQALQNPIPKMLLPKIASVSMENHLYSQDYKAEIDARPYRKRPSIGLVF